MRRIVVALVSLLLVLAITPVFSGGQGEGGGAAGPSETMMGGDNESPMLAEMVANGELPPLADRIPENPRVIEVIESIGQYGGTLFGAGVGGGGIRDTRQMLGMDTLFDFSPEGIVPSIVEDFELSSDGRTLTLYFREGLKWSDGEPVTTDDMVFWYEDMLLNDELTPSIPSVYKPGGEVFELVQVDDFTVRWEFADSYPGILFLLAHAEGLNKIVPAHYLGQFHEAHADAEELQQKIDDTEGVETWYDLFNQKFSNQLSIANFPELPTLNAFMLETRRPDGRDYVRNPYYWKVDAEGNQLPYIDRVSVADVTNPELFNAKVVSGEVDLTTGFQTSLVNLSLYRQAESDGGYDILMWDTTDGVDIFYTLNPVPMREEMRPIFSDTRFRHALSLGIDRQDINDTLFLGFATPRQFTNLASSSYFEPGMDTAYIEYDPDRANALLDEMGLEWNAAGTWRLGPDGQPIEWAIEFLRRNESWIQAMEICTQYWEDLGLRVTMREIGDGLYQERINANEIDMTMWHGDDNSEHRFTFAVGQIVPVDQIWHSTVARPWHYWYISDGEDGIEPPDEIKEVFGWVETMRSAVDADARIEAGTEILRWQSEYLMSTGLVKIPKPVIKNVHLRNVPDRASTGWDYMGPAFVDPAQYYFEAPRNQ